MLIKVLPFSAYLYKKGLEMLRFLSAGESHGKALTGILEGMVSNLEIRLPDINKELSRRQKGFGRGGRMKIERDSVEILSGIRGGMTTGAPISFMIRNRDWENWQEIMDPEKAGEGGGRFVPRPGHADLPGVIKYRLNDIRDVIERSSARETAVRTAAGAICKQLLLRIGIKFYSRVIQIGKVIDLSPHDEFMNSYTSVDASDVRNTEKASEMRQEIEEAISRGESIGGVFEIISEGVPPGIGSYVHWERRIDANIACGLMSIPGIKGVEIGSGFGGVSLPGSKFHDSISRDKEGKITRASNNAGGIEGGITNGEDVWVKCAMKPIPTIKKPLGSFDIRDKKNTESFYERSDTCGVVPACVVGENFLAYLLCREILLKFGGDSLQEFQDNYRSYMEYINKRYGNS